MRLPLVLMLLSFPGCQRGLQGATDALPAEGAPLMPIFATAKRWPWQPGVALPSFLIVDSVGVVWRRVVGIEEDPARRMDRVRQALAAILERDGA